MESPEAASEMACPIVLQAVAGDKQLLLSLPFTPSTYHVVIARAVGADAKASARKRLLKAGFCFMFFSSFFANVSSHVDAATADPPLALLARPVRIVAGNEREYIQT